MSKKKTVEKEGVLGDYYNNQVRDDNGFNQVGRGEGGEAWSDSRYILKSAEFVEKLVVRYEREVLRVTPIFFSLNNLEDGVAIYWDGGN